MVDSDLLTVWTIYFNPTDYPGQYVVRGFDISPNGPKRHPEPLAVATSIEAARAALPPGLVNVGRVTRDDPVIVESWV